MIKQIQEKYGLNDEQAQVILTPSPTLVNASAGAGKTRCLIAKIRHIIDSGASPKSILAITFTNKAAREMKERLEKYYSKDFLSGIQMSTIHSMCVSIIRAFPQYTPIKLPFSIYDDSEQMSVIKSVMKANRIDGQPYDILSKISYAKSFGTVDKLKDDIADAYKGYQAILIKNNACDFDDLQIYALSCLKNQDCKDKFSRVWQNILVDEMQDTSSLQLNLVTALYSKHTKTMFVVGDRNQSIYGWRAAKPENMQDFKMKYKANECFLTYNYRSSTRVIDFANNFLQYGKPMVSKSGESGRVTITDFDNAEDEADEIAQVAIQLGNYNETAVLYRLNSRSLHFERAFSKYRIPYQVVGALPFFKRKVVKDMLAYFKAANNPADTESLVRVINTPKRGFGDTKQEQLFLDGRPYLVKIAKTMPQIADFLLLLDEIRGKPPQIALSTLLIRTGYAKMVKGEKDEDMLEEFKNIAGGFNTVEELILYTNFQETSSKQGVKLLTAHSSKGLEFDNVFVVGLEKGVWPHEMNQNLKEEYRLFYVASTRARRYLNISFSKERLFRGEWKSMDPSIIYSEAKDVLKKEIEAPVIVEDKDDLWDQDIGMDIK